MKFIVDAQLPPLLASWLLEKGFDILHTNDLLDGDETQDYFICQVADEENRVVITKDSDFYDSHLVLKQPAKLLLVTTGNLKNRQLLDLFRKNIPEIIRLFIHHTVYLFIIIWLN